MRLSNKQWASVAAAITISTTAGLGAFLNYHESGGKQYLKPYRDSGGVWTVCDGVTGPDVDPSRQYTVAECAELNAKHRKWALFCVEQYLPMVTSSEETLGWASVCYSIGEPAFRKSSFVQLRRNGKVKEACESVKANYHRGGGIPHLLDDRRLDETELICGHS
jgi:lysozyme